MQRFLRLVIGGQLCLAPVALGAQTAALDGSVRLKGADAPIPNAEVEIPALSARTRTDSAGTFRFPALPVGRYLVIARRIGFAPTGDTVTIAEHRDQARHFELRAAITALDTAVILSPKSRYISPTLRGFEERRANGFGKYIPEDVIRKNDSRQLADVVRMLPGISLRRQGPYTLAASSRRAQPNGSAFGVGVCYASVYLDGMAVYEPLVRGAPPKLEDFQLNVLAAIEYYPGEASTPVQFRPNPCGILLLWTRER